MPTDLRDLLTCPPDGLVQTGPNQWAARCPCHEDNMPSLSLTIGNNSQLLVHCQAGCGWREIKEAIGVTNPHQHNGQHNHGRRRNGGSLGTLVAQFDYRDETGRLLYQACRYESAGNNGKAKKTFRQRRPDGQRGWCNKLGETRRVLYRLPELIDADPSQPVLIPEGEKHVDRLRELGFVATCNVGGAGKWKVEYNSALANRDVVILPDNDQPGRDHARKLAQSLNGTARSIKTVELPGLPEKGDILDFFDAGGTREQLVEILDGSAVETVEQAKPAKVAEEADDPHRLARLCREKLPSLVFYRSEFYLWESPAYRTAHEDEIRANIDRVVKDEFDRIYRWQMANLGDDEKPPKCRKVTRSLKANVLDAVKALSIVPFHTPMPCWLDGRRTPKPERCIVTRNRIVPVDDLDAFCPPTPDLFTVNAVPFGFDWEATCPGWIRFLETLWPDDPESIDTLQEIFGYLLLPETRHQKAFMLIGPKRSGKGTIGRVLRQVVGPHNVAAPTLGSLAGEFGLQPLLGTTVAIIGDARISGRTDSAAIVERILSITGEDLQTVNRKHLPAVSNVLPVRFVLISNELPRLDDASATFPSRIILLRLRNSFYGREDHALTDRLLLEAPGILNWALEGLHRLRDRGHFVQPQSSRELLDDLETLSSPMAAFVRDCCQVGPGFETSIKELYSAYKGWADDKGRKSPSEQVFGRDLRAAVPAIDTAARRDGVDRFRVYIGIRLSNDTR